MAAAVSSIDDTATTSCNDALATNTSISMILAHLWRCKDVLQEMNTLQFLSQRLSHDFSDDSTAMAASDYTSNTDTYDTCWLPVETVLHDQNSLNHFTCYLFERRYGWSGWSLDEYAFHSIEHDESVSPAAGVTECPYMVNNVTDAYAENVPEVSPLQAQGVPPPAGRVRALSMLGSSKSVDFEEEARVKARINEILDRYLCWYKAQVPGHGILAALEWTLRRRDDRPVVRNQVVVFLLEWLPTVLREKSQSESTEKGIVTHLVAIKSLLIIGLCDVWSAIRAATAKRMGAVIEMLSLSQVSEIFLDLVCVCESVNSTWQAVEGSLLGITCIIHCFQWLTRPTVDDASTEIITALSSQNRRIDDENTDVADGVRNTYSTRYCLRFGSLEMSALPDIITTNIKRVIYKLLAHPQLSIRENATKAFAAFLTRSEFREALISANEVVHRLLSRSSLESPTDATAVVADRDGYASSSIPDGVTGVAVDEGCSDPRATPLRFSSKFSYNYLHAYEAEGLLSVGVFLIKHVPPSFLLPNWPIYFATFDMYLTHPASTVRQVSSTIFKYLVTKDTSSPLLLKLVLQGLAADWTVELDSLNTPFTISSSSTAIKSPSNFSLSNVGVGADGLNQNLSAYNSCDPRNINISNGDDSLTVDFDTEESMLPSPRAGFVNRRRKSIEQAIGRNSNEVHPSSTWEWREGRMLAFELILKFLITNHIHYMFPSYLLPTPRSNKIYAILLAGRLDRSNYNSNNGDAIPSHHSPSLQGDSRSMTITRKVDIPFAVVSPKLSHSALDICSTQDDVNNEKTANLSSPNKLYMARSMVDISDPSLTFGIASSNTLKASSSSAIFGNVNGFSSEERLGALSDYARDGDVNINTNKTNCDSGNSTTSHMDCKRNFTLNNGECVPVSGTCSILPHELIARADPTSTSLTNCHSDVEPSVLSTPTDKSSLSLLNQIPYWEQNIAKSRSEEEPLAASTPPSSPDSKLKYDSSSRNWMSSIQFEPLSSILHQMLLQVAECIADTRWELRRMGDQVLPLLAETICWFDLDILIRLWDEALPAGNHILCYVALLSLKYALTLCAQLDNLLSINEALHLSKRQNESTTKLLRGLCSGLSRWSTSVRNITVGPHCDKMTLVALEVLILIHVFFNDCITQHEHEAQITLITSQLTVISAHAHPLSQFTLSVASKRPFVTVTEGLLSCFSRLESPAARALHVEWSLISNIHALIPGIVMVSSYSEMMAIVPLIVHLACVFGGTSDDVAVTKSMLDGVLRIMTYAVHHTKVQVRDESACSLKSSETSGISASGQVNDSIDLNETCDFVVTELLGLLECTTTEAYVCRRVLDVVRVVFVLVPPERYVKELVRSLISRLLSEKFTPDSISQSKILTVSSLEILSNDIPITSIADNELEGKDSDDGSTTVTGVGIDTTHHTADIVEEGFGDADEGSDWDSDDDEAGEVHVEALGVLFSEFLREVRKSMMMNSSPRTGISNSNNNYSRKTNAADVLYSDSRSTGFREYVGELSTSHSRVLSWLLSP